MSQFLDADTAIDLCNQIIKIKEMIRDCKAYLFDTVYIEEDYPYTLDTF